MKITNVEFNVVLFYLLLNLHKKQDKTVEKGFMVVITSSMISGTWHSKTGRS